MRIRSIREKKLKHTKKMKTHLKNAVGKLDCKSRSSIYDPVEKETQFQSIKCNIMIPNCNVCDLRFNESMLKKIM